MRRPCIISNVNVGTPFCAYTSFVGIAEQDEFWEVFIDLGGLNRANESSSYYHVYAIADTEEEANAIMRILEWQLAQALNPPIKVTQAVLDAMVEVPEANFYLSKERTPLTYFHSSKSFRVLQEGRYYDLDKGNYIQADCPLALRALLDFNEEGELFDA